MLCTVCPLPKQYIVTFAGKSLENTPICSGLRGGVGERGKFLLELARKKAEAKKAEVCKGKGDDFDIDDAKSDTPKDKASQWLATIPAEGDTKG